MTSTASRQLLAAVPMLGFLQGCLPGEPVRLPVERHSGRHLSIWIVETRRVRDRLLVHGVVRGSLLALGPVPGHLHVSAKYRDDRPTASLETHWGSMTGGKSRLADFYVTLPVDDPSEVATIDVSYVARSDDAASNLEIHQ